MRDYREGLQEHIPYHMHSGIILYVEQHLAPGGFLFSMLTGDFDFASQRADTANRYCIPSYILFFQEYLDEELYGSVEIVNAWLVKQK